MAVTEKLTTTTTPAIISHLEILFLLLGVHIRPKYEKLVNIYFYFYTILIYGVNCWLYLVYLFTHTDSLYLAVISILYVTGANCLYGMLVSVRMNREHFIRCYHNVLPQQKYNDDKFYELLNRESKSKIKLLLIIFFVLVVALSANPLMAAILLDVELGSLDTLISSHVYPWDMSTKLGYTLSIMYQAYFCSIAMSPFILMAIFVLTFWVVIMSQFEILSLRIESLDDIAANFKIADDQMTNQLPISFHKKMLEELAAVIEHHRYLKTISDDFINAVRGCVILSIFSFTSINVLLFSAIILAQGTIFGLLKMINLLLLSMSFFFIKCYIGEYLYNLNEETKLLLYSTHWFDQSVSYKKEIITFLIILQNPLRIQFMGTYDLNLNLLMQLIQKIYAGIQLLLKMTN